MIFGTLNYFWLWVILIFAMIILLKKFEKTKKIIRLLTDNKLRDSILINFSRSKNLAKLILSFVGLLFVFIALLSPQWNRTDENIKQKGRDIYIALDISRSMLAKDLAPNRLEFAKNKIKSLINLIENDRVGLILFSGSAFVSCPLTRDLSAFYMFLDQVDSQVISSGTTSMEHAIEVALNKFENMPEKMSKLLVIFTDGEDFSSNLAEIKKRAQAEKLKIFSVGAGTQEGSPIPLYDESGNLTGHQMNSKGTVVISQLNEGILKALSQECGAIYVKATNNNEDINFIANKIKEFEEEEFADKKILRHQQQYPYFIFVSFLCFLIEWLL